ncbi:peptidyl-prolyl cis-trans isomerase [Sulfobacillus harzensis]|uniref:peptidylprolyl isomerase n=1 Tax=Sulfobacillus harzensis TaxID=2729629 RepID=A0A7Y0Q0X5_9FIRM|nr:peptidyl-prolyl cis-trans isomerase [Sulfobacillus harzensis]NMP20867.1 hypothetical protein [Sulfobacillus harzensis]
MKRQQVGLALSISALGVLIAGCGTHTASASGSATVATVNGQKVTQNDVNLFVKGLEFMQGQTLPTSSKEKALEVKAVVAQTAVNQWAIKHHLITEKKAKSEANQFISSNIEAQVGGKSGLTQLLKSKNLTFAQFQSYIADQMVAQSVFTKVTKNVKAPTTAQEQSYYQKNKSSFTTPPQDEVSDIVVKTNALAQKLLKEAKGGSSFATLAKHYSIASTGKSGGSLGYLPATSMSSGMAKTLSGMKVGQYATYHGSQGYHVIWLQATKPSAVAPFSKVQSEIQSLLQQQSADTVYQNWTKKMEKSQHITIKKS